MSRHSHHCHCIIMSGALEDHDDDDDDDLLLRRLSLSLLLLLLLSLRMLNRSSLTRECDWRRSERATSSCTSTTSADHLSLFLFGQNTIECL